MNMRAWQVQHTGMTPITTTHASEVMHSWQKQVRRLRAAEEGAFKARRMESSRVAERAPERLSDVGSARAGKPLWEAMPQRAILSCTPAEIQRAKIVNLADLYLRGEAIGAWRDAAGFGTIVDELQWDVRNVWMARLHLQLIKLGGAAFAHWEHLREAKRLNKAPTLQTRTIPTLTTHNRAWGLLKAEECGRISIQHWSVPMGAALMGLQELETMRGALESMSVTAAVVAVGNGMQLDVATAVARFALRKIGWGGETMRIGIANAGLGIFMEAIREVARQDGADERLMEYIFWAEASEPIAQGHANGWKCDRPHHFVSSHRMEDVAAMARLGHLDGWQFSPSCYAVTPNNREGEEAKAEDVEQMMAQLRGALQYPILMRPAFIVIENVAWRTLWGELKKELGALFGYKWYGQLVDPVALGGSHARTRSWVVGILLEREVDDCGAD